MPVRYGIILEDGILIPKRTYSIRPHMQQKEHLIQKLFHNQCSQSELDELFELINREPLAGAPEVLPELMEQMGEIPQYDRAVFSRIKDKIAVGTAEIEPAAEKIIRFSTSRWISIAASVLIVFGMGWISLQFGEENELIEQTKFGEIRHLSLPDGSMVSLNGNSALRYAPDWQAGETRKVYLDGEAFFEITKKPATQAKFQVITQGLTIEVLGTSFNVNHRNQATAVFLEEGKVTVQAEDQEDQPVVLKPGEIIQYSATEKKLTAPKRVSGKLETSWKTGMLDFDDVPLLNILNKLAEFNEFTFEITDEDLLEEKLTASIPAQDIEKAMSILAKTTGIDITLEAGRFLIKSK